MKIFGHNTYRYMQPESDDGSGSGGSTTVTPPAPPAPPADTFTKAEVDNREAKMRRTFERKQREQEAAFQKQLDELKAKVNAPAPIPATPAATGDEGRLELLEARWAREREDLVNRIAAQEATASQEKKTRMDLQRDRQLDDALQTAGVAEKNFKLARRYFAPDIIWDELDQEWMFKSTTGNLLTIVDGVQEYLPENLKPSRIANGGAGTQSGLPGRALRAQRTLDEAKVKLQELHDAAMKNKTDNAALARFSAQKTLVRSLEADAKASIK